MNALRIFLAGIFTRHLGTKFLSLLLSVTIFLLVQQSLTGVRELPELTLDFQLAETLLDRYVVLRNRVDLAEVRLKGKHAVLDPLVKELARRNYRWPVVINPRFFNAYAQDLIVEITPRVLRDEAILGPEVEVLDPPMSLAVLLDRRETKKVPLVVSPAQLDDLKLGSDAPYLPAEGERLDVTFSTRDSLGPLREVTVEGPESALRDVTRLCVRLGDVRYFLQRYQSTLPEETLRRSDLVEEIDLAESGIEERYLPHIRVKAPGAAGLRAFKDSLQAVFRIREQLVEESIRARIQVVLGSDRSFDIARYDTLGSLLLPQDLAAGTVDQLQVRMPKSLVPNKDLLDIVLVLDLSKAEAVGETLYVPLSLRPADLADPDAYARVRRVAIKSDEPPKLGLKPKAG